MGGKGWGVIGPSTGCVGFEGPVGEGLGGVVGLLPLPPDAGGLEAVGLDPVGLDPEGVPGFTGGLLPVGPLELVTGRLGPYVG